MNHSIIIKEASQEQKTDFDWGQLTWFASDEFSNASTMTIGRCILNEGSENPLHRHPNCSEILVVMEGTIEHTCDDQGNTRVMNPGDTVTIPPQVPHQARNIGSGSAILFIAFDSAQRETIGE